MNNKSEHDCKKVIPNPGKNWRQTLELNTIRPSYSTNCPECGRRVYFTFEELGLSSDDHLNNLCR